MDKLPVEILSKIIDHLAPREKVQLQSISKKFFDLARDNNQWRLHCYEESWAARQAARSAARPSESVIADATVSLSTLGQESLLDIIQPSVPLANADSDDTGELSRSEKARAAAEWDSSAEGEHVDWYSEYIARHGPISLSWVEQPSVRKGEGKRGQSYEVKGMGLLKDWSSARQNKIVAPLEDGSVCIWDLNHSHSADSQANKGRILGVSEPGILMTNLSGRRDHSPSKTSLEFINLGEGVSVDSLRQRAYLAVGNVLNEVDLETLKVISQQRYPWSIFALSQETDYSVPLTLATTLSLQIYDSRLSAVEEEEAISSRCERVVSPNAPKLGIFAHSDSPLLQLQSNGQPPTRIRSPGPSDKGANYAPLFQPGPLSILHPPAPHVNTILLAGRFPSILCYDRRYFPRLQTTVHSGGRLCGLASVPAPRFPVFSDSTYPESHSVVACGDYNGRGSLELYNLKPAPQEDHSPSNMTSNLNPEYKNRQSAASSKLLSVGSHGNRIVFSDAEGNIKWTERNGRSEVRRWNINTSQPQIPFGRRSQQPTPRTEEDQQPRGLWPSQSPGNNEVARKVLPTGGNLTGDELLIWTGERIGHLKFSIPADYEMELDEKEVDGDDDVFMHAEVDEATREEMRHRRRDDWEREQRYGDYMRRALERQADEVRWMGNRGLG
ncbi:Cyclin-like F-box [Penicillium camemberti]|uniref:Cyclin-like F-box n=1 Tax=Penicillium camemberti (strain FM 013) TaxID=1429867 RepID=A0A0G4P4Y6_PENC3|nr:Cyclin-like F-box [Penicillium camemberti]